MVTADAAAGSLENGFDYVGNDLANMKATSAGYYCDQCELYAGCKAFTWSTYNNDTCWFKSTRGRMVAKQGVISVDVYPPPVDAMCGLESGKNLKGDTVKNAEVTSAAIFGNPVAPSCALEVGVDYVDHDIGNKPSKDAYGCCSICMATNGCRAFSWTDHEGGTCWLKSAKGDSVKKDGAKSAVV
ncbi:hypothetical protein BBJ28_00022757 [Nothophytophthora sp. Chile5]|nr:hypothetical protein BBJ28_00022757 [Nothophytophthora sp. Chile5]